MKYRYTEDSFRNKISIISVACCMLVIWIHTNNMEVYGITDQGRTVMESVTYRLETIWGGIEGVAVPMFFFISGFLFYRNYDLSKAGEKYKSRFKSILVPYLIWATFYYLFFTIISWIPSIAERMNAPANRELSLIGWLSSLWTDQYYTLWFLKNLIVMIAVSPVIYILLKNRRLKEKGIYLPIGIAGYALVVIMLVLIRGTDNEIVQNTVLLLSGFEVYGIGAYLGINHKQIAFFRAPKLLSYISLLYFLVHMIAFTKYTGPYGILSYLDLAAIWFATDLLVEKIKVPKWLQITFFVYVAHDVLLEAFEKVFLIVFGVSPAAALADFIIMLFVVMAVLVLISLFMKRYMKSVWKVVAGYR